MLKPTPRITDAAGAFAMVTGAVSGEINKSKLNLLIRMIISTPGTDENPHISNAFEFSIIVHVHCTCM